MHKFIYLRFSVFFVLFFTSLSVNANSIKADYKNSLVKTLLFKNSDSSTTLKSPTFLANNVLPPTVRVACIGNSITAGYGLSNIQSYPHQLNLLLGDNYLVGNYGLSGTTMLSNGDSPYINSSTYTNAVASNANIVIIKLGTNDSKTINWQTHNAEFPADYKSMIDTFKNLSSQPGIFIVLPSKAFSGNFGINENNLVNSIRPEIVDIALDKGISLIDLFDATKNFPSYFPDGVHPNAAGSLLIAQKVSSIITTLHPTVISNENTLTAPQAYAYQWYKNDVKIEGATMQNLTLNSIGSYKVLLKINQDNEDRIISNSTEIISGNFPPSNPVNLTATASNNMVNLNWDSTGNATVYNISRKDSVNGILAPIETDIRTNSFTDNEVQNGITYFYAVSARNNFGESNNSNIVTATPFAASATINTNYIYTIISTKYGKVLDAVNTYNINIQISDTSNTNSKKWRLELTPDGYYKIINMHSLKSLSTANVSGANDAFIIQSGYSEDLNQKWIIENAGNNHLRLLSATSNKLADAGPLDNIGEIIFQNYGTGNESQLWELEATTLYFQNFNTDKSFAIYPIPARSLIYVASTTDQNIFDLKIYNTSGQLVYSKQDIHNTLVTIPVNNFANGMYMIRVNNENAFQKIIVSN